MVQHDRRYIGGLVQQDGMNSWHKIDGTDGATVVAGATKLNGQQA
jgi:hypothetical protein